MKDSIHPLAIGRTAEIFAWDDGRVLKLYREWCPRDWIEYELKIGRIVQNAGLPVSRIGDIVEVDGRRGIIYERIEGISALQHLRAKPWTIFQIARQLAELHAQIHACAVPADLPTWRDGLARSIRAAPNLPSDLRDVVLRALEVMPDDGAQLCHGDFHPDNVMLTARGPIVIDWMTAKRGAPAADIARTVLLLRSGTPVKPSLAERGLMLARERAIALYLQRYRQLHPLDLDELVAWQPIIAAARMNERIPGEEAWLQAMVRAGLG